MICPKCGAQVQEGTLYCTNCGNTIGQTYQNTPGMQGGMAQGTQAVQGTQGGWSNQSTPRMQNGMAQGAQGSWETSSTPGMQSRMPQAPMPPYGNSPQKPKGKGVLIGVIIAVIVLALGAGGLLFWSSNNASSSTTQSRNTKERDEEEEEDEKKDDDKESEKAGKADKEGEADVALAELLVIINETLEAFNTNDSWENLSAEEYDQKLNEIIAVLEEKKNKANAIKGLPENVCQARDEFFDVMIQGFSHLQDLIVWAGEVSVLGELKFDPDTVAEGENRFEKLYELVQEYEGKARQIKAPVAYAEAWDRFIDVFTMFKSVLEKGYQAEKLEDPLRFAAASNMLNRTSTLLSRNGELISKYIDEDGNDLLERNIAKAAEIAEELDGMKDLSAEEIATTQIKSYVDPATVYFDHQPVNVIYPSLYGAMDQIISMKAVTLAQSRDVLIEVEIPGFTQKYSQTYTIYPTPTRLYIKPPLLTGDLNLNSAKDAQLMVNISNLDGSKIESQSYPIRLMSKFDIQWVDETYGDNAQDHILCFLTPENPKIADLQRKAIDCISELTGGQLNSLIGYQGAADDDFVGQAELTYIQTAGLMNALSEMGVRYNMDAFSMSGQNALQRVKHPEDVLNDRSGLCIETSLTIASALQSATMHAMLVFPPGHAQVAVETWRGSGEYFLIETTKLPNTLEDLAQYMIWTFDENSAVDISHNPKTVKYMTHDEWIEYLANCYVLDCDDSVDFGLTAFTN